MHSSMVWYAYSKVGLCIAVHIDIRRSGVRSAQRCPKETSKQNPMGVDNQHHRSSVLDVGRSGQRTYLQESAKRTVRMYAGLLGSDLSAAAITQALAVP